MKLVRISSENVPLYKKARLAALENDPRAFCSTFRRELAFPDAEWQRRSESLDGKDRIGFLALDEHASACGLIACFRDAAHSNVFEVLSMWVAPSARRTGVGSLLLDAVIEWATDRGGKTLCLSVMKDNGVAMEFYRHKGFRTCRAVGTEESPATLQMEKILC